MLGMFTLSMPLQAGTIYDLSSASTEGAGQNTHVATSATQGGQNGSLSRNAGDDLVFTHGGTTGTSGDYFFGKFSPQTLGAAGDTLSLNFVATVTYPGTAPTGAQLFRLGFFNTGGLTTEAFGNQTGYRVDFGTAGTTDSGFRERTGTGTNLFASATTSPKLGTQNNSDFSFTIASGVSFSGSLTITLLDNDQVRLTAQIGGLAPVTTTDAASVFKTFDTFSFFYVRGLGTGGNTLAFDSLSVSFSSIPEPATIALLCGLAGLLPALAIRRRN